MDVERGRTVPNWCPRRLGGGLGTTRVGGEEVNQKHSGRLLRLMSTDVYILSQCPVECQLWIVSDAFTYC
ncbi:hypothetical protein Fmac_014909 [Flemingia macrophylla]|uniref:Uncharacterized protein n=1 Tax=Flemingia macrophylla TaxID=520843 RepID=A0ABD1MD30_9FABA